MKIAILGNMNNNFIALTKYLRDEGHEAHLFYEPVAEHFQPKADSFSLDYLDFSFEVNWTTHFNSGDQGPIQNMLVAYDFFIGQGNEAAFASWAGFQMDIYFPYGSDFYKYAWLPHEYSLKQRLYNRYIDRQGPTIPRGRSTLAKYIFDAITQARFVFLDHTNEAYEAKLLSLPIQGQFEHVPMPFIYLPQYVNQANWDVHWKSEIDQLRKENDFLLLYHGRQEWLVSKTYANNEFSTKNTDHLIRAFAAFEKHFPGKARLVMIEYGNDVPNSKSLIEELGIRSRVSWFPKMYRKDLMYLISQMDVCSGEFGKSYLTFGTIIEAMSMAKPVIHFREDSLYNEHYPELYPMYNGRMPHELETQLLLAAEQADERTKMGKKAQDWVKQYFIQKPLERIKEVLNEKMN